MLSQIGPMLTFSHFSTWSGWGDWNILLCLIQLRFREKTPTQTMCHWRSVMGFSLYSTKSRLHALTYYSAQFPFTCDLHENQGVLNPSSFKAVPRQFSKRPLRIVSATNRVNGYRVNCEKFLAQIIIAAMLRV